jgi:hypothetical protein
MRSGSALLDPTDVQRGRSEVDLLPAEIDQLRHPEAVPVGHKNHRGVPLAVAVAFGRLGEEHGSHCEAQDNILTNCR